MIDPNWQEKDGKDGNGNTEKTETETEIRKRKHGKKNPASYSIGSIARNVRLYMLGRGETEFCSCMLYVLNCTVDFLSV